MPNTITAFQLSHQYRKKRIKKKSSTKLLIYLVKKKCSTNFYNIQCGKDISQQQSIKIQCLLVQFR